MKYVLRQYQDDAVEDGLEFFNSKNKKNVIEVLPTAAGKSLIVANIARRLEYPTIVLQPSRELLVQNYEKFISYGEKASIYSASMNSKEIGQVTFTTIGSIYKKPELFDIFKYVIADECHISSPNEGSMYRLFFENLNTKLLGLTATPFRLKSYSFPERHSKLNMLNRIRPKIFDDIIHVTQIKEMVDLGFWSPVIYFTKEFDKSKLVLNSTGANYTDRSIAESIKSQGVLEQAIEWAKKLKSQGRKRILIFAPNIESSEYLARRLGLNSVSSETDTKDRDNHIRRFKEGLDWGICNVNVLSVGFDEQRIDAIIDLSPTLSLARYYQKLGRGVRIDLNKIKTKEDCIYVDLVGNSELFGRIEDLMIEKIDNKWNVISNGKILTNTPIIKPEDKTPITALEMEVMKFGKFKGKYFKEIPKWYWKYVKENFDDKPHNRELLEYANSVA